MGKEALDIGQVEHLQELGVDTSKASMCWLIDESGNFDTMLVPSKEAHDYVGSYSKKIYAYTFQDLIDRMPVYIDEKRFSVIKGTIIVAHETLRVLRDICEDGRVSYTVHYGINPFFWPSATDMVDAAYLSFLKLIEDGYVNPPAVDLQEGDKVILHGNKELGKILQDFRRGMKFSGKEILVKGVDRTGFFFQGKDDVYHLDYKAIKCKMY